MKPAPRGGELGGGGGAVMAQVVLVSLFKD
jgi:hypothetical protein